MSLLRRSFQLCTISSYFQLKLLTCVDVCEQHSIATKNWWRPKKKHMYGFITVLSAINHWINFSCNAVNIAIGRFNFSSSKKKKIKRISEYLPICGHLEAFSLKKNLTDLLETMKKRNYLTNRKFEMTQSEHTKLYPNSDVSVWMRSCEEEITTPINGKTSGTIPAWLNGSLLRNGPGSMKVSEMQFEHLFDSSALLHKYVFA